jgi:hypothetical protein
LLDAERDMTKKFPANQALNSECIGQEKICSLYITHNNLFQRGRRGPSVSRPPVNHAPNTVRPSALHCAALLPPRLPPIVRPALPTLSSPFVAALYSDCRRRAMSSLCCAGICKGSTKITAFYATSLLRYLRGCFFAYRVRSEIYSRNLFLLLTVSWL